MAVLELDFAAAEVGVPLEPDIDDFGVFNDVTAKRRSGSSATVVDEDGPLGVDAIGRKKTRVDVNPESDADLPNHAGWHLALNTIEDARFPQVTVDLDAVPSLAAAVSAVDVGDLIRISNLPDDLVPDLAELVILGYIETVPSHRRLITFNTLPATVYQQVGVYGTDPDVVSRYDSAHSTLAAAVDADDTDLLVVTEADHALWVTGNSAPTFPLDVGCSGIRLPVSEITSCLKDEFGRTSASTWTNPDIGAGPYVHVGGVDGDYTVGSGRGSMTSSTVSLRRAVAGPSFADGQIFGTLIPGVVATGASFELGLVLRHVNNTNFYTCEVRFLTTGLLNLRFVRTLAGSGGVVANVAMTGTYNSLTQIRARFELDGSTLRARAWDTTGPEPGWWQLTATDGTPVTGEGRAGAALRIQSGNTNLPLTVSFDDLEVVNPQTFTVLRKADGADKALAAGSQVRLWKPARWGL